MDSPTFVPASPVDFDPFATGAVARLVPLTAAQREVWTATQFGADASCAYNESVTLTLRGALDAAALGRALDALVARHEALRATIAPDGTTMVVDDAGASLAAALRTVDLAALAPEARARELAALREREVTTPFALEFGPLFRATLVRLAADEHALVLGAHHVVCDGWSFGVLLGELGRLYTAEASGAPAGLAPAPSFAEYAASQDDGPAAAASERWWLSRLAAPLPTLELPTDRPHPPLRTFAADRVDHRLDPALVRDLRALGARAGTSLFTVLLTGFVSLLERTTGQDDVIVAVTAAGQALAERHGLVGHCVSALPLRAAVDPARPFDALLREVRAHVLDAFEHGHCTIGRLLERLSVPRDPSRIALTPVIFNLDPKLDPATLGFAGLAVDYETNARRFENFELFVSGVESRDGLVLECQYNTALFDASTIARRMRELETLLRAAVADAATPVGRLALLPPDEEAALRGFNATALDYDRSTTVVGMIAAQAALTPQRVAVKSGPAGGEALTYAALDARATRLARHLQALGAGPGDIVGLCVERGPEMVVAVLAILRTGAAYLPLDPEFPRDRLAFMLDDAGARLLVTERALAGVVDAGGRAMVRLDDDADAIAARDAAPLDPALARPDALAYVIYTSGSTGRPKGVRIRHGSVVNLLESIRRAPGFGASDVLLAVSTLSFDIAVIDVFLPLVTGGCTVVATRDMARDGGALLEAIRAHGVTFLQATPATWRLLLDAGWSAREPLLAVSTGEPLPDDLARELVARVPRAWNLYGPTETTVWCTGEQLRPGEPVTIGPPLHNTRAYVVSASGALAPVGVAGELCIAGDGVAEGYHGRPELTAERFVDDPWVPGARMYRTGDLARWRPDGRIEHLGRLDFQVKLRGYRIELGEIEAVLARVPGVAGAVAAVQEPRAGDQRLVAFYVAADGRDLDEGATRDRLRAFLPGYMVPQRLRRLDRFPLTPTGKVDRRALPMLDAADAGEAEGYVAPRTPLEATIADLCGELLGLARVGVETSFFDLGVHSLMAARLLAALRQRQGIALPLRALFESPTVAGLARAAARLDAAADAATPHDVIPRLADDATIPLSLQQQRLWLLEQLEAGRRAYNVPAASRLRGPIDVDVLRRALQHVVDRHEVLRTTFVEEAGHARAVVHPVHEVALPVEPLDGEAALERRLREEALVRFDLGALPLIRFRLFRLAEREHVLALFTHHAVWDGWSFDILWDDLQAAYGALAAGHEPALPPLPVRYRDFAAWQRATVTPAALAAQRAFWVTRLAAPLPVLELPSDRPRPPVRSDAGDRVSFELPAPLMARVRDVAREQRATPAAVLLALYGALLQRWTGQQEVVVGLPVRARDRAELERVIGFFVDVVPLRLALDGAAPFASLVAATSATTLEALAHGDMPFELLVQELDPPRDFSRTPVYQTIFSFQDGRQRPRALGEASLQLLDFSPGTAQVDLGLWFLDFGERTVGALDFSTDLFERATIERMRDQFLVLADAALSSPARPVATLPLLPAAERARMDAWNATAAAGFGDTPVTALVAASVARRPDAVAVSSGADALTYAALDRAAARVAAALRARGVARGDVVAVCMERGVAMLPALLGVLATGAAYLPLDPEFPAERLAYMLGDAGVRLVLADDPSRDLVEGGREVLDVVALPATDAPLAPAAVSPADLAYVIYTSGSTGRPKGVEVTHGGLANLLRSMAVEPGLSERDVLVAVTTLSFDIAGLELWLPLVAGARVEVATRDEATEGADLAALLARSGATVLQATPATWRMLVDAGWRGGEGFTALCGGEALPPELARVLLPRVGRLFNLYGPTETTIWSTLDRVTDADAVTIGRPIANTVARVLTPAGELAPIGVPGELCLAGAGVARGYRNQPALTAERFVDDPLGAGRLYRTGDRARWRADGRLEHLGRFDFQLKLRGHRMEAGEIEAVLASHPAVRQAVVDVREAAPGDARLVAWVVFQPGEELTGSDLRRHARDLLPRYMIPGTFVTVDELPLTANGKVDRRALPDAFGQVAAAREFVPPATRAEQAIAAVWRELLRVDRVGADDNFFEIGGHSLLSMVAVHRIEQALGARPHPRAMFFQTLRELAATLDGAATEAAG